MYPFVRIFYALWKFRNAPKLGPLDTHVSQHYCLPWDIDLWRELNNGRTLTLYDIGRIVMAQRNGTAAATQKAGFGLVVAGASVRYRKRITMFQKFELRTRLLGVDEKFIYIEQSMWLNDETCANHILLRGALVQKGKMIPPTELLKRLDGDFETPELPQWAQAWVDADKTRPWPPTRN